MEQNKQTQESKSRSEYVPMKDDTFFTDTKEYHSAKVIIESEKFFPVWVSGPKGCGKTSTIKQVCAELEREYIRVNFNQETDESELFGSIELVEGENGTTITRFNEGPVINAMRRGAVLMLDEIDTSHPNKVLCLQSVLEGQPAFIKSQNTIVHPEPGFTVFATSNTKGRGCDTGEYIGTNIMNGAMLDRFCGTIEQNYPTKEQEAKILQLNYAQFVWAEEGLDRSDVSDEEFDEAKEMIGRMCLWAEHIRKNYEDGVSEEVISTRSLINIIRSYSIFKNEIDAVELSCQRYGTAEAMALVEIYKKLCDKDFDGDVEEKDDVLDQFLDEDIGF